MYLNLRHSFLIMCLAGALTIDAAPNDNTNATTQDPQGVSNAYDKAAKANRASFVTEIAFDKGSSELSVDAKNQLKELLKNAQGKTPEYKIISWADREYPVGTKTLDKDARKLADERGFEIKNFLVGDGMPKNVSTYNMAEQPDAIEKLFKSSGDLKLKRSLEEAGLSHPDQNGLPRKASRAMVMVILR
jgi:hypothetical protein